MSAATSARLCCGSGMGKLVDFTWLLRCCGSPGVPDEHFFELPIEFLPFMENDVLRQLTSTSMRTITRTKVWMARRGGGADAMYKCSALGPTGLLCARDTLTRLSRRRRREYNSTNFNINRREKRHGPHRRPRPTRRDRRAQHHAAPCPRPQAGATAQAR